MTHRDLPTSDELKLSIGGEAGDAASNANEELYQSRFHKISVSSETAYLHLAGLKDHYDHKKKWSYFLIGLMAFMVMFQSILMLMVGYGYWDFSKYQWLLPVLLVQNLGQIVGLAVFVVKALFKDINETKS